MTKPSISGVAPILLLLRSALLAGVILSAVGVASVLSGLLTLSASAQRTAVNEFLPVEAPAAHPAREVRDNESAVHHIRTRTRYADGYTEVRHGTGFVVGRRFITVNHNVDVLRSRGAWERRIELGGVVVEPAIVDAPNDIAIFDVP